MNKEFPQTEKQQEDVKKTIIIGLIVVVVVSLAFAAMYKTHRDVEKECGEGYDSVSSVWDINDFSGDLLGYRCCKSVNILNQNTGEWEYKEPECYFKKEAKR